jgi:hypothetical protein
MRPGRKEEKSPRPRPPGTTAPRCFCRHQAKPVRHRRHPDTRRLRPRSPDHPGHCSFDGDCARAHLWPPPCLASPAYKRTPASTLRPAPLTRLSQTSSPYLSFPRPSSPEQAEAPGRLLFPAFPATSRAAACTRRMRRRSYTFLLPCRRSPLPLRRSPSPPRSLYYVGESDLQRGGRWYVPIRLRSDEPGPLSVIFFFLFSPPAACSLVGRPRLVCMSGPGEKKSYFSFLNFRTNFQMPT